MKRFEKYLEVALRRYGWENEETLDLNELWWASRAWRIRSSRANFGFELVLTFVGHYMDGNTVEFDAPVWETIAAKAVPSDYLTTCESPPYLSLMIDSRDYPDKVETFVAGLRERYC